MTSGVSNGHVTITVDIRKHSTKDEGNHYSSKRVMCSRENDDLLIKI